jgi:hypothetical protein
VSVDETLPRITSSAVANVPGPEYARISIRRADGFLETLAPTAPQGHIRVAARSSKLDP